MADPRVSGPRERYVVPTPAGDGPPRTAAPWEDAAQRSYAIAHSSDPRAPRTHGATGPPAPTTGRSNIVPTKAAGYGAEERGGRSSGDPGSVASLSWYSTSAGAGYAAPSFGGSGGGRNGGSRSVDLAIVFDGTESMKPYWVQCKAKIVEIVDCVKAALPEGSGVRVGVINYRDVGVSPPVVIKGFSSDIEDVKHFIATQVRKQRA